MFYSSDLILFYQLESTTVSREQSFGCCVDEYNHVGNNLLSLYALECLFGNSIKFLPLLIFSKLVYIFIIFLGSYV